MISCARNIHLWATREDADRCCNGWIRLWVPFNYGEPGYDWYTVIGLGAWRYQLIPEQDTEEIERLLAIQPMTLKSSTKANPWLKTHQ